MVRKSYLGEMLDGLLDPPRRLLGGRRNGTLSALCDKLLSETTEVSTFQTAAEILAQFAELDDAEKRTFFQHINDQLELCPEEVIRPPKAISRPDRQRIIPRWCVRQNPDATSFCAA